MTFVLRMAWRETRASWPRLLFFFLCVALGVAAIVVLRSVVQNVRITLTREAPPTSSSVTIRRRADRETNASSASATEPPERSASSRSCAPSSGRPRDRGEGVHAHPRRPDLERECRGQSDHRHLGGGVGRAVGERALA